MSDASKPVRMQAIKRNAFWWTVSRFAVLVICKLWFRVRFEGADKLPKEGSVLLVSNHSSYLDPGIVGISARRPVGFLAQAGLASFAPCRWWLAQVGVTLIDRDAPSKAAMRFISDCLKAGEVVGIFPEGTRSADGSVDSFKGGVEFLVRRSKTTVVPIGIDGSHRAYPRGSWFPRPRKVIVRYGEPWTAEAVLAKGGVDALRQKVAELARCSLKHLDDASYGALSSVAKDGVSVSDPHKQASQPGHSSSSHTQASLPESRQHSPGTSGREGEEFGIGRSGKGSEARMVDSSTLAATASKSGPASNSTSAGGGA